MKPTPEMLEVALRASLVPYIGEEGRREKMRLALTAALAFVETNDDWPDQEYWALLYYTVEEPGSREGSAYLPIFPDIHALYHTWQEAEAVRKAMINPLRYWVKRVRFEDKKRIESALKGKVSERA